LGLLWGLGLGLMPAPAAEPDPAVVKEALAATQIRFDEIVQTLASCDAGPVEDQPDAHAIYDRMIASWRKLDSFGYTGRYICGAKGKAHTECTYQARLKKPNFFRIDAESRILPTQAGILIGDGERLWIHWPYGRIKFDADDPEEYEKTRLRSYYTKPAPPGGHSIGHETALTGSGLGMPVLDPSTFFGYTDSLQEYLDGVRSMGSEEIAGEPCDRIEVSIMKHQRSWYLWISQRDYLPRKLLQVVRVSYDIIMSEEWSSLAVNVDMPDELFAWKPPEDWVAWQLPRPEERLLKPGTVGPDFDLESIDGQRIKLADHRGKILWLYFWRAG